MANITLQQLEDALVEGYSALYNSTDEEIEQAYISDIPLCNNISTSLYNIISCIEYKIALDEIDDVTDKLYYCLMSLIDSGSQQLTVYYGSLTSKTILNQSQIESGSQTTMMNGSSVVVPFNASVRYLWFAIPNTQLARSKYEDTVDSFNYGNIGSISDLFGAFTTVGPYKYYITNWITSYTKPSPSGLKMEI